MPIDASKSYQQKFASIKIFYKRIVLSKLIQHLKNFRQIESFLPAPKVWSISQSESKGMSIERARETLHVLDLRRYRDTYSNSMDMDR